MQRENELSARTLGIGVISGMLAWIIGYLVTFVIVSGDVSESSLTEFIEAFEGRPAVFEQVGWIFFNAHGVAMVARDVPFVGRTSRVFIGGEEGFSTALYLIPIFVLFITGILIGYRSGTDDPLWGVLSGISVVPGYLFVTIAGIFLFAVQIGGATAEPDPIPGIVLAGIVWPTIFGGVGGAIGAILRRLERS